MSTAPSGFPVAEGGLRVRAGLGGPRSRRLTTPSLRANGPDHVGEFRQLPLDAVEPHIEGPEIRASSVGWPAPALFP